MKKNAFLIAFLLCYSINYSQVGIGTTTPDDSAIFQIESTTGAFIPPRMTSSQMNAIPTPLDGAMVFNTSTSSYHYFSNGNWTSLSNSSIIINKQFGSGNAILTTPDNTYVNFPVGLPEVIANNPNIFNVISNGTIAINQTGNYLFSASLSTRNMPSGSKKYILALYINSHLVGYLSRGVASLTSVDYWGTSGNIMFPVNHGDTVAFKYVLNNSNVNLDAACVNIGITHLN